MNHAAEVQLIVDEILQTPVGVLIKYSRLSELLGREFRKNRRAFYKAKFKVLASHRIILKAEPNKGYVICNAEQGMWVGIAYKNQAFAKLQVGQNIFTAVNQQQLNRNDQVLLATNKSQLAITLLSYGLEGVILPQVKKQKGVPKPLTNQVLLNLLQQRMNKKI